MTSTTKAPAVLPISTPSADFSLTDPTTWITLLSIIAAIAADVIPHVAAQAYVAPAATIAAAIVTGIAFLAKHSLGATLHQVLTHPTADLDQVITAVQAAGSELPSSAPSALRKVADDIEGVGAKVEALITPAKAAAASPAALPSTVVIDGATYDVTLTPVAQQLVERGAEVG